MSRNALNLNLLNYNMKILQVAFLLLFNKYICICTEIQLTQRCVVTLEKCSLAHIIAKKYLYPLFKNPRCHKKV